jgi:hypothetical protein
MFGVTCCCGVSKLDVSLSCSFIEFAWKAVLHSFAILTTGRRNRIVPLTSIFSSAIGVSLTVELALGSIEQLLDVSLTSLSCLTLLVGVKNTRLTGFALLAAIHLQA